MIRSYKHGGHYTNDSKIAQIVAVSREYRFYHNHIMSKSIQNFYQEKKLPRFLPTSSVSKLSERYRQTCGSQVKGTLLSWIGNIENRVRALISFSTLAKDLKHRLFVVNKLHLWFGNTLSVDGVAVSPEEFKLCRRLFKQVRGRYPSMKNPSMLLDRKVATVEAAREPGLFDYWIKFSTLVPRKLLFVPLKTYDYFSSKDGQNKNAVQVIVKEGQVDFALIKDIPKQEFPEKKGEIGVDLGLVELINTSTGNRYGITLFPLLKKYDKIIVALRQGRMRRNLMTNSQWLDELYAKVTELVKNEVGRALNQLISEEKPELIVVERLKHLVHNTKNEGRLSKTMRRLLIQSGISQLRTRLEVKCEEYGITLVEVNPAYTSQECHSCHYIDKDNRRGQKFKCLRCGNTSNADYNGSVNVLGRRSIHQIDIYTPYHKVKEILEALFSRQDASDREAMLFDGLDPPIFRRQNFSMEICST